MLIIISEMGTVMRIESMGQGASGKDIVSKESMHVRLFQDAVK